MADDQGMDGIAALLADADPGRRDEGRRRLEAAAEAGSPPARAWLGELLIEADPARARALITAAAEAGQARGRFLLGLLHARGLAGLACDLAAAERWCAAAADQGLGVAQYNLALLRAEAGDAEAAARWWRLAAINGIDEAAACLDLLYRQEPTAGRPRIWDEAETRASVALERSDPDAPKSVRFAEYYVDPCIDLVATRFHLPREDCEDIVQQFMLELEEPLSKGAHRGRQWKEALRERFRASRGAFRPFLGRVLDNFARDWLRARRRRPDPGGPAQSLPDPALQVAQHEAEWRALLAAWRLQLAAGGAEAERAGGVLEAILVDQEGQQAVATRLGLGERWVRRIWRLGVELLIEWLERRGALLGTDEPVSLALRAGLRELPVWLHHPSADKRQRILLFLALLWRRTGGT